jgi:hypothetical protein
MPGQQVKVERPLADPCVARCLPVQEIVFADGKNRNFLQSSVLTMEKIGANFY